LTLSSNTRPSYLELHRSGALKRRSEALLKLLEECRLCPRHCRSRRLTGGKGACLTGRWAEVASWCIHQGEEPCISGKCGSGTVFFAHCNLSCLFCQNHEISQEWPEGKNEIKPDELADVFMELQAAGAHNINWVSPSHVVPQAVEALEIAAEQGLSIPIVYNSNGYDSVETLRLLDGIVDIYMPDLKYASNKNANDLSAALGYVENSRAAIGEMWRQTGPLEFDGEGVAERGLLVRHLVLPGDLARTREVLAFLARLPGGPPALSLMAQYHPSFKAVDHPLLNRPLEAAEYEDALSALEELKIESGYVQQLDSSSAFLPDFHHPGNPFEA